MRPAGSPVKPPTDGPDKIGGSASRQSRRALFSRGYAYGSMKNALNQIYNFKKVQNWSLTGSQLCGIHLVMRHLRTYKLTGKRKYEDDFGNKLYNVHAAYECRGRSCPIDNPSDHPMRHWKQLWRVDRCILERICCHGVGHPDPDERYDPTGDSGVHGCDGCCRGLCTDASDVPGNGLVRSSGQQHVNATKGLAPPSQYTPGLTDDERTAIRAEYARLQPVASDTPTSGPSVERQQPTGQKDSRYYRVFYHCNNCGFAQPQKYATGARAPSSIVLDCQKCGILSADHIKVIK